MYFAIVEFACMYIICIPLNERLMNVLNLSMLVWWENCSFAVSQLLAFVNLIKADLIASMLLKATALFLISLKEISLSSSFCNISNYYL